jgi:hypothetical protein
MLVLSSSRNRFVGTTPLFDLAKKLRSGSRIRPVHALSFSRPLVVLQSDDWGRVGVRDREGYEQLRAGGIHLGEHPYDYYSLETAEDVVALRDMLKGHRDATGRPPCLVMNFVLANLDFWEIANGGVQPLPLMPLRKGLPGQWRRPGLFEAYRQGISDNVFYPALHGLTHCCQSALEHAVAERGERSLLLKTLWKAETPYIYWRMPWVGYEYCNLEKPQAGFLTPETQANLIAEAAREFERFFGTAPFSACAPGSRANGDTHAAWAQCGVRVAQDGMGTAVSPHMDEWGLLNLHRTVDIEPSQRDLPLEKYVQLAEHGFERGIPAIVSMHSINFHSSLKDFRGPSLRVLDEFLSSLEAKHPNLLYVHDMNLYEIVTRGKFRGPRGLVSVEVKQQRRAPKSKTRGAS